MARWVRRIVLIALASLLVALCWLCLAPSNPEETVGGSRRRNISSHGINIQSAKAAGNEKSAKTRRWEIVLQERVERLKRGCEYFKNNDLIYGRARRFSDGYVLDPSSGLAFCHIPKAASTWWLNIFASRLNMVKKVKIYSIWSSCTSFSSNNFYFCVHKSILFSSGNYIHSPIPRASFLLISVIVINYLLSVIMKSHWCIIVSKVSTMKKDCRFIFFE